MPIRALPMRTVVAERFDLTNLQPYWLEGDVNGGQRREAKVRRHSERATEAPGVFRVASMFVYTLVVAATSAAVATEVRGATHQQPQLVVPGSSSPAAAAARQPMPPLPAPSAASTPPPANPLPLPAPTAKLVPIPRPATRPASAESVVDGAESEPASKSAQRAVAFALKQLGVPYRWGGANRAGFDCSGLVMRAWGTVGVRLPHEARLQARAGIRVSRADLQPGDLVISNGFRHVAMYIGHGRVVQAPHSGSVVSTAALPTHRVDAYVRVAPAK